MAMGGIAARFFDSAAGLSSTGGNLYVFARQLPRKYIKKAKRLAAIGLVIKKICGRGHRNFANAAGFIHRRESSCVCAATAAQTLKKSQAVGGYSVGNKKTRGRETRNCTNAAGLSSTGGNLLVFARQLPRKHLKKAKRLAAVRLVIKKVGGRGTRNFANAAEKLLQ